MDDNQEQYAICYDMGNDKKGLHVTDLSKEKIIEWIKLHLSYGGDTSVQTEIDKFVKEGRLYNKELHGGLHIMTMAEYEIWLSE